MLQRRSRNSSEVFSRHDSCREGGLNGIHELVIHFRDDRLDLPVGAYPNDLVAHQAGHPYSTLCIKSEAVGKEAVGKLNRRLACSEGTARTHRVPDQSAAERLDDVEESAGGIEPNLIGIVQAVGNDARAALRDAGDEAIGDVGPPCELPRVSPRADGDPRAAIFIFNREVRRGQRHALDLREKGRDRAVRSERPDAAAIAELRDQEGSSGSERDSVRAQGDWRIQREPGVDVTPVRSNDAHAAPPVGCDDVASRGGDHAFGSAQAGAYGYERIRKDAGD